ncbi:hypothetical protein BC628DRAFT_1389744 [Trametes gibbosa]|nr:hypothetical protein BC628DRAFT_1389744 [Trametes gibbosa]
MSSSGYDNATIVSWIANGQSIAWTVLATAAFQVYDYMICLDREPVLFWRYPFTAASILYIVNRYSGLVRALYYIIAEFTQYRPQSIEVYSCIAQWYTSYAFDLTPLLPAAVFSSLRTYALTQHITLAVLVFVLSLGPFVVNWTGHSWSATFEIDPVLGCSTSLAVTPTIAKIFATTARLPLVIADLIVVVVTWIKTYELRRAARSFGIASLADVMFRNGETSLLMNITHFTLTMLSAFGAANNDGHSSFFSRIIDPCVGHASLSLLTV